MKINVTKTVDKLKQNNNKTEHLYNSPMIYIIDILVYIYIYMAFYGNPALGIVWAT